MRKEMNTIYDRIVMAVPPSREERPMYDHTVTTTTRNKFVAA